MHNFKRLLQYLKPYRFRVALAVALMFVVTLSAIPLPLLQQQVIDVAIPRRDRAMLWWIFWGVIALYGVRGLVSYILNYLIGWLGQRVIFDLRSRATGTCSDCRWRTTTAGSPARSWPASPATSTSSSTR
jgi:ABC-type multidrug transport system fused ATPase/permease subunit